MWDIVDRMEQEGGAVSYTFNYQLSIIIRGICGST